MSEFGPGPDFMEKFNLHKTPEVDKSVEKLRRETAERVSETDDPELKVNIKEDEKIPETKEGRVGAHFDRIFRALELKRGLFTHLVEERLLDDYTINLQNEDGTENTEKIDQLVMGLFESEKEILRRRGMGADLEQYPDRPTSEDYEKYRQQIYGKKQEQEKTLSIWTQYFGSEEANHYPIWFKYLALRSLRKMGKRDRDTETYSKRSADTLQPFPDLSREALAKTLDAMTRQSDLGTTLDLEKQGQYTDEELVAQAEIDRLTDKGDFARLYAHFQGEIERARRERGEDTAGEWRHFPKGSDASVLCKTLEGKGTEWCTAGLDVAKSQLSNGEFYIYYTYDEDQQPTVPRVAIFLVNGQISEVRGVYGKDQDLELPFIDIAREKYQEFPGSERYGKADHDMKLLSKIEDKVKAGEELNKDDLIFLYEIDSTIEGFGHGADPRVAELRATRNPKEDAPIVFDCAPEDIAWNIREIGPNTRAYVGEWSMEIFQKIRNFPKIEHLYESFPDKKIFMQSLETDPSINSFETADKALKEKNDYLSDWGKDILGKTEFSRESKKYDLVRFTVGQLGFPNGATTDEIYQRAQELGLELCPAEVGPHLRLQYRGKEWMLVAMKQIVDRYGDPSVFDLFTNCDQLALYGVSASPSTRWRADGRFVFRFRKGSQES